ncbi:hypothetical protein BHM03_00054295, partial [Ensete ventricosum]
KHEEDCLVQDATLMRRDQPAGCVRRDKTPVVARCSRTASARWCQNYQKGEKASESMRC